MFSHWTKRISRNENASIRRGSETGSNSKGDMLVETPPTPHRSEKQPPQCTPFPRMRRQTDYQASDSSLKRKGRRVLIDKGEVLKYVYNTAPFFSRELIY
eukprot:Gregarina_sp_Poly_1__3049@NODE_1858_length_3192_cov_59_492800_g1203_i0_p5_GENE_NODE_1858_length_3192_cov_59_492800_g1203_i0NODE_1858_length_3192_cov_59_492800_g1203_i0_p5_ORF_typecomplete_len100_score7_05_NODE_1858_length_3192_cov_59_492800_g1203_i014411740